MTCHKHSTTCPWINFNGFHLPLNLSWFCFHILVAYIYRIFIFLMLPQFKIYIQIIYINPKKYTKIIQKSKEYLGCHHLQISQFCQRHRCASWCMIWPFVSDRHLKWVPAAQSRHIEETLAPRHLRQPSSSASISNPTLPSPRMSVTNRRNLSATAWSWWSVLVTKGSYYPNIIPDNRDMWIWQVIF